MNQIKSELRMHLSEKTLEIFAQKINSKKCNTSRLSQQLCIQKNNLANMWTIYQRKFLTICVSIQEASGIQKSNTIENH